MASVADEPLDPALAMVARAWDPAKEMVSYLHNHEDANDGELDGNDGIVMLVLRRHHQTSSRRKRA